MSYARRAVTDFDMIKDGDKIAIGLSGGKDSLSLLAALNAMRRYYPERYELAAITVSLGFQMDFSEIKRFCAEQGVEYHIVETDIAKVVFDIRKEDNPCSLCSKMRKGALNEAAKRLGCNKVALGHSKDDVVETLFMSMFFEGQIKTFAPVTFLDRTGLYAIRPLIYADEKDIISFVKKSGYPVLKNACPADKNTKRQEIKEFVHAQGLIYKGFDEKIFGAIKSSSIKGW